MDDPLPPDADPTKHHAELEARIRAEVDRRLEALGSTTGPSAIPPTGTLAIVCPTGVVELMVKTVAGDSESKDPVMILCDRQERLFLPIWIGKFESDAIIAETEGRPNNPENRPMTHDLFHRSVIALGGTVTKVVISELIGLTFFAQLFLDNGSVLDARPSDSVALALKFKAPIFAAESVISQAAILDYTKVTPEERAAGRIELT